MTFVSRTTRIMSPAEAGFRAEPCERRRSLHRIPAREWNRVRQALFKAATAADGYDRLAQPIPRDCIGGAASTLRDNLFRPGQECIDAFLKFVL